MDRKASTESALTLALQRRKRRLDRSLLWRQVYEELHQAIVSGELAPGSRLIELDIGQHFEVSQATVRDALKQLANDGLVMQFPRRGSFVATVDIDEAREAYRVRAVLERLAATEYCEHGDHETLSDLDAELSEMRAAATADDLPRFVEHDVAFHRIVWEATGNPLLPRIWTMIEASHRSLTLLSNRVLFDNLSEIAETHVPLVDSLRERDAELAADLFMDHAEQVWKRLKDDPESAPKATPHRRTRS